MEKIKQIQKKLSELNEYTVSKIFKEFHDADGGFDILMSRFYLYLKDDDRVKNYPRSDVDIKRVEKSITNIKTGFDVISEFLNKYFNK